ncbi:MAG: TonB-dependent receptor [Gemmatimonadota bacterium]
MNQAPHRSLVLGRLLVAVVAFVLLPASAAGQTINGTLMEVESGTPISLGLVIMMTESGDSVTSGVTNGQGRFSVDAPEAGSFYLIASAFGFKETAAGVFELGGGGEMDVEFRIAAAPMPIDGILVSLQRPALQHQLVKNGFVRRVTRGLGHFITPVTIERTTARTAADLFRGIPGVLLQFPQGGLNAFEGETLRMTGVGQYCTPTIYLDGARMAVDMTQNMPIDLLAPLAMIDAVEIYRRPSEVPIEYGMTSSGDAAGGPCGVVVIWTKTR